MTVNRKLFNHLLNNIYYAIRYKYYTFGDWGKNEYKMLDKKIKREDQEILYNIILILLYNTNYIDEENIYMACLYYYYSSLVIDQEVLMFNISDVKNYIDKYNISFIKANIDVNLCWNLIKLILCSDELWASTIRKLVYFPSMIIPIIE